MMLVRFVDWLTDERCEMALIDCPECGRRISSTAEACPGCGYPVAERRQGGSYLRELARDADGLAHWDVAKNPSAPADVLRELVRDAEGSVRLVAAANPNIAE